MSEAEGHEAAGPTLEAEEVETLTAPVTLPGEMPILPLKNTVIFPHLLAPLLVNTERSKQLIDAVMTSSERLMLAVAVKDAVEGSPSKDELHQTGTVLRIAKMLRFPDDSYRLLVQGVARARIDEFTAEDPFFRGRLTSLADKGEADSVEAQALARDVRDQFVSLVSESAQLSDELQVLAMNLEEPSRLADLVASKPRSGRRGQAGLPRRARRRGAPPQGP